MSKTEYLVEVMVKYPVFTTLTHGVESFAYKSKF